MHRSLPSDVQQFWLDKDLHRVHKEGKEPSVFGMDNTSELIDGGFGLYSSRDLKRRIGPLKTEYFRIGLMCMGTATIEIGLESFRASPGVILTGFPGQIFSLYDPSPDFFCYYMLFSESFIENVILLADYRRRFPFLHYDGVQCFQLSTEEAMETEAIIHKMDSEIQRRQPGMRDALKLYIQLILILANRRYSQSIYLQGEEYNSCDPLFTRFVRLVSEHYRTLHKVSAYAHLLHVTPDHLNRVIKSQSQKTALQLIDEMRLNEAKSHLRHTTLSIAEIAYKLEFSDPSHFNKFFRKYAQCTPLQFREKSD